MSKHVEGTYHIALLPDASEENFIQTLQQNFITRGFFNRITRAVDAHLFKVEEATPTPHYILDISIELMMDRPYDFVNDAPFIAELIEGLGVVIQVDTLSAVEVELR